VVSTLWVPSPLFHSFCHPVSPQPFVAKNMGFKYHSSPTDLARCMFDVPFRTLQVATSDVPDLHFYLRISCSCVDVSNLIPEATSSDERLFITVVRQASWSIPRAYSYHYLRNKATGKSNLSLSLILIIYRPFNSNEPLLMNLPEILLSGDTFPQG
jgi:hypothetical protein